MLAQSLGQGLERRLQGHGRKDGTSPVMNFRVLPAPTFDSEEPSKLGITIVQ